MNDNFVSLVADAMLKDLIVSLQPTPEQKRHTYNMLLGCEKAGISAQQFVTMITEYNRLTEEEKK